MAGAFSCGPRSTARAAITRWAIAGVHAARRAGVGGTGIQRGSARTAVAGRTRSSTACPRSTRAAMSTGAGRSTPTSGSMATAAALTSNAARP